MDDILRIIDERRQTYLDWLIQLCQQPSISAQDVGMAETAALVVRMMKGTGMETRLLATEGYPVVYGEAGRGEQTLSFYNHYDVQPPEPLEEWDTDPFSPVIRDGVFFARGVADNKANLVARMAAVDAYQRARGNLPLTVKFIVEGEEEIGSPNLAAFCQEHQALIDADACLWEAGYADPEGRPEIYLGVKGILYVELKCRSADQDLHSMYATIVPNAAWRILWALNTLKDEKGQVAIPGFYDKARQPSAADLQALQRMHFDEEARREQLGVLAFNNNLSGELLLRRHIFEPTCNICGIWAGYTGPGQKTVIPREATAKVDFRLVPDQDPYEVCELLRQHLLRGGFDDIEIRLVSAKYPARTSIEHPFAHLVISTARELYSKDPVVYPMVPGSGPMYELCQRFGIPAVSIGVSHAHSHNHAPNENIYLKDFYLGIVHLVQIMERFATKDTTNS